MSHTLFSFLMVSIVVLMVPWILLRTKIKVPFVAAEILLGVVFGQSGLSWIQRSAPLNFLALFGLSFIMFLYGLETKLDVWLGKHAHRIPHSRWLWPVAIVWLVLGLVDGIVFRTLGLIHRTLAVSLLLGSSAPTVLLPTLKVRGLIDTPLGQWILSIGLIVDFISLLGVTVLAALSPHGADLRLFLVPVLFVPLLIANSSAGFLRRAWFGYHQDHATGQIGVRAVMMIITLFIVLADLLGTVTVLGAYLAGVVVSMIMGPDRAILEDKLDAIGFGYFIPFFFVTLGAELNLRPALVSGHVFVLTLSFLLGVVVISVGIWSLLARLFSRRTSVAISALLATRLSVTVAGSLVLYQAHIISNSVYLAMIMASVLSVFGFPPLFYHFAPKRASPRSDIILVGASHWTHTIATDCAARGQRVYTYPEVSQAMSQAAIHLQTVRVVALIGSTEWENHIRWGKQIATAMQPERVIVEVPAKACQDALAAGLIPFVASVAPIQMLETMIGSALSYQTSKAEGLSVLETTVTRPECSEIALGDILLRKDMLVIDIARGLDHLVPCNHTVLKFGDLLTIFCSRSQHREIRDLFEGTLASEPNPDGY